MPEQDLYFAAPGVSQSMLKTFLRSPVEYKHQYVDGGAAPAASAAMNSGSLMHCLILEPQEFNNRYLVFDESQRPSPEQTFAAKVNKEWKAQLEAQAAAEGKLLVQESLMQQCGQMLDVVNNHQLAETHLLDSPPVLDAHNEMVITRACEATGISLKGKLDRLLIDALSRTATIVDYKTTSCSNLTDFGWAVKKYGYDIQAAFYEDLLRSWLGVHYPGTTWQVDVLFVPQKTAAPYQVLGVCKLPDEAIAKARDKYTAALMALSQCLETGIWEQQDSITTLFAQSPVDALFSGEVELPM